MQIQYGNYNKIINNTVINNLTYNNFEIAVWYLSNSTISNNIVCGNGDYDIFCSNCEFLSGDNTCDKLNCTGITCTTQC